MITPDLTCSPNMPSLPVGKQSASAALLGSSIFHCGGFDGIAAWEYEGTCFSYLLASESRRWETEESMKNARWSFGLTAIGGRLFATGGYNSWASYSSVESFSHQTGWVVEESMELVDFTFKQRGILLSFHRVLAKPWRPWRRVGKCQIFYTDQYQQTIFYTDISVILALLDLSTASRLWGAGWWWREEITRSQVLRLWMEPSGNRQTVLRWVFLFNLPAFRSKSHLLRFLLSYNAR